MLLKELEEEVTYLYHPDRLGSVSVVSNQKGLPYERVEYLPFGEVWIEETDPATGYIPFRFTSKELDEETGLYYHGARYYEPTISRWMSADPAGFALVNPMERDNEGGWRPKTGYSIIEAANWYAYVSHNPVKYVDPTGERTYIFSISVIGKHRHLFIAIKKDGEDDVKIRSLYPKSKFVGAITGLDVIKGKSTPDVHDGTTKESVKELKKAENYFKEGSLDGGLRYEGAIEIPEGMTEEEFDQAVLDMADTYPVDDRPYDSTGGYNSNTFVDDVIEAAGGMIPDVEGATQQNYEKTPD